MMKRYGRVIIAAGAVALLLGWVLVKERGRAPEKGEAFGLKVEQASALTVKKTDQTVTLRKEGEQWTLAEPVKGWADKDAAERMIKALAQLKPTGSRKGADLNKEAFGLAKPALTATLTYDGNKTATLYLGATTADNSEYFARIEGRDRLYFVPTSVFTDLTQSVESLRDKALAHVKKEEVKSLTLQYPDRVLTVEKRGTAEKPQWMLTQPYQAKADEWTAKQIGDKLADLKAEGFAPEQPAAGKSYGFDKPTLQATVMTADGKQTVITFGAKAEESVLDTSTPSAPGAATPTATPKTIVYAQVQGRPEVLMVADSNMTDLQKTDFDLRDKRIVSLDKENVFAIKVERKQGLSFSVERSGPDTWRMVTPSPQKANKQKIEDIVWDISELEAKEFLGEQKDLKPYGLALADTIISVTLKGQSEPIKIYVGYKKADGIYYARTSQDNQVYTIGEMLLLDLPKTAEDLKDTGAPAMPPGEMPPGMMPPGAMPPGAMPPPGG
jgi:hypothetical protein